MTCPFPLTRLVGRACLVALLGALVAAVVAAAPASAAASGKVAGTVTVPAGHDPADVKVSAKKANDLESDETPLGFAFDGAWSLDVPAGRWVITFEDDTDRLAGTLVRDVVVTAGRTTTIADVSLVPGVTARGTATLGHRWDGERFDPAVAVHLAALDPDTYPRVVETGVNRNGAWRLDGLAPGRYRATFGGYLYHSQCYGAGRAPSDYAPCRDRGTIVTVGTGGAVLEPVVMRYRWTKVVGVVRGPNAQLMRGVDVVDLRYPDGDVLLDRTGSDGRFEFYVESMQKARFEPRAADRTKLVSLLRTYTSPAANQTVRADVRLKSRTTIKATARGGKRKATVVVRVTPRYAKTTRTGTVKVRYTRTNGTAAVRKATLPRSGTVSVHLPRAKKGKRALTVTYGGSARMLAASTRTSVRVR